VNDVRALAGYLHAGGRDLVVVVLQNHRDVHQGGGTRVQDAVLRWVLGQIQPALGAG
jgi:D-alanyl-D-alanine carboxypeptidase/D-alanyl-D-alanine-endopeptidase (penicillin-binding protein 4)